MFSRRAGLSYERRGGPTVSGGAERDTFSVLGEERERERDSSDTDGWTPPSSTLLEHEICDTEWKADLFQWSGGGKAMNLWSGNVYVLLIWSGGRPGTRWPKTDVYQRKAGRKRTAAGGHSSDCIPAIWFCQPFCFYFFLAVVVSIYIR